MAWKYLMKWALKKSLGPNAKAWNKWQYHGNYAGPGWSAGKFYKGHYANVDWSIKPIDRVDAIARWHDKRYWKYKGDAKADIVAGNAVLKEAKKTKNVFKRAKFNLMGWGLRTQGKIKKFLKK